MPLLVTAEAKGRPISEVYESAGEALRHAQSLSETLSNVRIRDPRGQRYTPEEFAQNLHGRRSS